MRQDDKEAFQKIIGCHPGCVPELLLGRFLDISRKLREALRWNILRSLNGQPKPSEQNIYEETIRQILALMGAYERGELAINYRLENWGELYEPYFDVQYLCDLRIRASAWCEGNTAAFLGQQGGAAYQSAEQSQRGKRREGKKRPLRHAVERIIDLCGITSTDEFIEAIENDDGFIPDLYLST